MLKRIEIRKNNKVIKFFTVPESRMEKAFFMAIDIAGGMYNGKDDFKVEIVDIKTK